MPNRNQDMPGSGMYTMTACNFDSTILSILHITEEISHLKDVDAILDKILFEARRLANADAGSIFLAERDKLRFSYVHNDTLFDQRATHTDLYADFAVSISPKSIVGYVALTRETLAIDNAYRIAPELPYAFNPTYDDNSGYQTVSMLTIPLTTYQNRLVGVMQLINAKTESGAVVPFSHTSQKILPLFAGNATIAIERGLMNRELILRMIKMAELRDPRETAVHAQRVGAYSAEIYNQWAQNQRIDQNEIKRFRDNIRLAAMLHDVGKVGIKDAILKKPGKLTAQEYDEMKMHTVYGARMFINPSSELDVMSRDIALNHHEKWAGGGYPGIPADLDVDPLKITGTKSGEAIPLPARITALADVYDALASKRVYKDAFAETKIHAIIQAESGKHFDPQLVEAFYQIQDVIQAIREKYADENQ